MKIQEYRRLAKISLKSRKKTTKSTIRGISFGLIFLMPIIFFALGININIKQIINKNPQMLYANVEMVAPNSTAISDQPLLNKEVNVGDYYQSQVVDSILLGNTHYDELKKLNGNKAFYYQLYNENFNYYRSWGDSITSGFLTIQEGSPIKIQEPKDRTPTSLDNFSVMSVVDQDMSSPESVQNLLKDGYNQGFDGDGHKQVIVSEAFIKYLGLEIEDVYLKEISLNCYENTQGQMSFQNSGQYSYLVYLDNDNDPNNELEYSSQGQYFDVFNNFKVVGIIDQKHIGFKDNFAGSSMIFTTASLFDSNGKTFSPTYTLKEGSDFWDKKFIATYVQTAEEIDTLSQNYLRLGASCFTMYKAYSVNSQIKTAPMMNMTLNASSYEKLDESIKDISNIFSKIFNEEHSSTQFKNEVGSEVYINFQMIYTIFMYASIILLSVGGIIFFSAMVNLFNTIMHSVSSRKNYLGVMRAIGAKNSDIPKLYFFETLSIFSRAMIWITIFGGGICVGGMIGINYAFKYLYEMLDIMIKISPIFIFYTFVIAFGVLFAFGFIFSYFCSRKVANNPIMQVLEG